MCIRVIEELMYQFQYNMAYFTAVSGLGGVIDLVVTSIIRSCPHLFEYFSDIGAAGVFVQSLDEGADEPGTLSLVSRRYKSCNEVVATVIISTIQQQTN